MAKKLNIKNKIGAFAALLLFLTPFSQLFAMGKVDKQSEKEAQSSAAIFPADSLPVVMARFSKDTILMGDQIDMVLTVYKDIAQNVGVPEITSEATEGKIEVIGQREIDTLGQDGRKVALEIKYRVTCFDAGGYKINPLGFIFAAKNKIDTLYSDTLMLTVAGYAIDTTTYQLHDIKAVADSPITAAEIKYYIQQILRSPFTYLVLLFIAAIIALTWYLVRRKHLETASQKVEPAHVVAIRALEQLNHKHLWQSGLHKEYYTALSDILRVYLSGRFSINGMEMTSDEIFTALNSVELQPKEREEIKELLSLSDFVKFAKFTPEAEQNSLQYQNLYNFVEHTKIIEQVNEDDITSPETAVEILVDNDTKESN